MKTIIVSDSTYDWIASSAKEMKEGYADQEKDEWWEEDDTAREIAEKVYEAMNEAHPDIHACPSCGSSNGTGDVECRTEYDEHGFNEWYVCPACGARFVQRFELIETEEVTA